MQSHNMHMTSIQIVLQQEAYLYYLNSEIDDHRHRSLSGALEGALLRLCDFKILARFQYHGTKTNYLRHRALSGVLEGVFQCIG